VQLVQLVPRARFARRVHPVRRFPQVRLARLAPLALLTSIFLLSAPAATPAAAQAQRPAADPVPPAGGERPVAQVPAAQAPAAAALAAMQRLDFRVGSWEGEGQMRRGPGEPKPVHVTERITGKLGGQVLLLEGLGTVPGPEGGEPIVVHQAFGVLSYDPASGEYRLRAFTAEGRSVDADVEVGDERLVWGFETPRGRVRYTLALDEQGRWHEVGEFSPDGATWSSFFEMTLERVRAESAV
jgi:hypothetical protein